MPNADFDIVLYHDMQPVALTVKTSLRERYKQADLEGMALKQVYRKAKSYLVTLSAKEAKPLCEKIQSGDVAGLDNCIVATEPCFYEMLKELNKKKFCIATKIMPIKGKSLEDELCKVR